MKKLSAFTLAEVLITLTVIGIVAAITLPSFIQNYQTRVRREQNRTIQYKLTKATDLMKSQGKIGNYDTTEQFINELKKVFKIVQVCSNDNLEQCWPTKTITKSDGKDIMVTKLKTGKDFNPSGYTKRNVGLITADGTAMIMSFKDDCDALEPEKTFQWSTDDNKPVTNATTSCIAMIYDLNGRGRPNKSGEDVKLFNVARLGSGLECFDIPGSGICYMSSNLSYTPMDVSTPEYADYMASIGSSICTDEDCVNYGDYWAGARKACEDLGGHLPSNAEMTKVLNYVYDFTPAGKYNHQNPERAKQINYITAQWLLNPGDENNAELLLKLIGLQQIDGSYGPDIVKFTERNRSMEYNARCIKN